MPRRHRFAGQALVEFAIVLPIFLVVVVALFDFGHVVWAQNSLASAAREGARFAIVHGGTTSVSCPVGPLSPDYGGAIAASCVHPSPSKQAIRNAALSAAAAAGVGLTVNVCYGAGCTGETDNAAPLTDGNNARGNPVTVVISSQVPLTVPSLLGFSSFSVSGSSTMLVNH